MSIPGEARLLIPENTPAAPGYALLSERTGGVKLEGASVSEVHRYPTRPEGFEEPLFHSRGSRKAAMEHFLSAPWLGRASELQGGSGAAVHRREEPVGLRRLGDGRMYLVRGWPAGHWSRWRWRRRSVVVRVLDRWREVGRWWEGERGVDRFLFRVLLSDGAVVDLARERPNGGWVLVGVVD